MKNIDVEIVKVNSEEPCQKLMKQGTQNGIKLYGQDASVCNNKQRWNEGKCRCECT